jgi:hypothetical protein
MSSSVCSSSWTGSGDELAQIVLGSARGSRNSVIVVSGSSRIDFAATHRATCPLIPGNSRSLIPHVVPALARSGFGSTGRPHPSRSPTSWYMNA